MNKRQWFWRRFGDQLAEYRPVERKDVVPGAELFCFTAEGFSPPIPSPIVMVDEPFCKGLGDVDCVRFTQILDGERMPLTVTEDSFFGDSREQSQEVYCAYAARRWS